MSVKSALVRRPEVGPLIMVDIRSIPMSGEARELVRYLYDDRDKVEAAADILGMKKSEFLRVAVVRVAEKVLKEAGEMPDE